MPKYIENRTLKKIYEWTFEIALAFAVFLLIQNFVLRTATISGDSMEPSFSHNDRIIVSRLHYLLANPKVNDVIIFPDNNDEQKFLVKRIIAKEFDVVDLVGLRFTVNGEFLSDDFSSELIGSLGDQPFPITVHENSYFVLGDNRNRSLDSRFTSVGLIPKSDIVGKAVFVFYPFSKLTFI